MGDGMAHRWHVTTTKPRRERQAELELRRQAFTVFNPRCRVTVVKPDGNTKFTIKQYIQGYVLVRFDVDRDPWWKIKSTRGVGWLLQNDNTPCVIRAGVVEALLKLSDDGKSSFVHDEKFDEIISAKAFAVGDNVSYSMGHKEVTTPIVSMSGHTRVGLMVEMFGRKIVASVAKSSIEWSEHSPVESYT